MTDEQKFAQAYKGLKELVKKHPTLLKLWTDADLSLLRESKDMYFSFKAE